MSSLYSTYVIDTRCSPTVVLDRIIRTVVLTFSRTAVFIIVLAPCRHNFASHQPSRVLKGGSTLDWRSPPRQSQNPPVSRSSLGSTAVPFTHSLLTLFSQHPASFVMLPKSSLAGQFPPYLLCEYRVCHSDRERGWS